MDLSKLTDSELYKLCQEYGGNAISWRRKFAGLLPEVERRELWRRRGFSGIYEFAFRVGGLSRESVDRILQISKKLDDKPALKEQLVSGSQSWTKIEKVAYIATPENEASWAKKVEAMPFRALEAYVKEIRLKSPDAGLLDNIPVTPQYRTLSFTISNEIEEKLRLAKHDLEKKQKQILTFNEVLKDLFTQKPETQIVIKVCPDCAKRKAAEAKTRHIPKETQNYILGLHNRLCAFKNCGKPATSLHHTRRFALNPSHNPEFIVPVCTAHERLVHTGFVDDENWRILDAPIKNQKYAIDQLVGKYRNIPPHPR